MELLFEWKQLFGLVLLLLVIGITINFIKRKIKTMKKILLLLFITFTFISCVDVKPNVSVKNDINLTLDGENIDGIQGEWIITSEEKQENGKEIVIITIKKNEIN